MFSHWICIEYRTQRRQPNSWIDGLLAFVIDIRHTKTLLPAPGSMLNWPGTRVGIVSNMFQIPGPITLRGHSCIGNSGAVLRRSFTGAIPTVITPTQESNLAPGSHSSPLLFPEQCAHLFLLVYLTFNFQNYCTNEDNGDDGS